MTQRPELLKMAERGRTASSAHPPLPRVASEPRRLPRCPACRAAAAEQVAPQPPHGEYGRTGVLLCLYCDQAFEPVQPRGWLATGPVSRKVVAE